MSSVYALLIASVTWIVWIPAAVLEKKVKGSIGNISIFPVIPIFPLAAWGLAYWLNLLYPSLGVVTVGGCHAALLAAMLISIIKSSAAIRHIEKG